MISYHSYKFSAIFSVGTGVFVYNTAEKTNILINKLAFEKGKAIKEEGKESEKKNYDDELGQVVHDLTSGQWIQPSGRKLQVFVVVRYPENHNPLLPLSLIRRLDAMGPQEFLTYVLNELSLEERESLMVDEKQRRKTFLVGWPYENNLSGIKMAQAGLFYVDDRDRVQCVFCRGSLWRWQADEIPMLEHARLFPFCRFVRGLNSGNREYRSENLEGDDLINITSFSGGARRPGATSVDSSMLGVSTMRAAHVEYAPEASRLRTYNRWPDNSAVSKEALCQAGYYYTGFDDQVCCFYCSIGLREWSITDDPWEEHARWYPDCAYLIQQKGEQYVNDVRARTPANKKSVQKTQAQARVESAQFEAESAQEAMCGLCREFGYSNEQISAAIRHHGGPFDSVTDMLDVIGKIESGELMSGGTVQLPAASGGQFQQETAPSTSRAPAQHLTTRFEQACRQCERKTGRYVPPTRVCLPCGHRNLCESCNAEEVSKIGSGAPAYTPKCLTCGTPLTGTIKAFLS